MREKENLQTKSVNVMMIDGLSDRKTEQQGW